jgi:lipopolysaccharide transport system ATP-binding protein
MKPILEIKNISKRYNINHENRQPYLSLRDSINNLFKVRNSKEDFWALKNVSFDVFPGDSIGVIGKNGAGKSTLLKILSKITPPSHGTIVSRGRIASLLEVGTGFHAELTGRENVFLNGSILGLKKKEIEKQFDAIIDFSGIEKFLDTPLKHYSSGMQLRLAFAVAAHLEPEILIIDEVLAVGDADFQKKCLGKMQEVTKNEGRTILFVSHSMGAISSLCTKGILMSKGELVQKSSSKDVIDLYISMGKELSGEILRDDINYKKTYANAYFEAIKLKNSFGEIGNSFSINEEINIEIEYCVLKDGEELFPSIHILDKLGTCILATFNGHSANLVKDQLFGKKINKGIYTSTCTIPANFLNDSTYYISAFLVPKSNSELAIAEEVLHFTIHDTGEMRKEYSGEWAGLIRPKMKWESFQKT